MGWDGWMHRYSTYEQKHACCVPDEKLERDGVRRAQHHRLLLLLRRLLHRRCRLLLTTAHVIYPEYGTKSTALGLGSWLHPDLVIAGGSAVAGGQRRGCRDDYACNAHGHAQGPTGR